MTGWTIEPIAIGSRSGHRESPASAPADVADLARTRDARAVAWLISQPDGATLRLYDAERRQTVSRALSTQPPYNSASAASVALSLRSLLRYSQRGGTQDLDIAGVPLPDSSNPYFPGRVAVSVGVGVRTPAVALAQASADLAVVWALGQRPLAVAPRMAIGSPQDIDSVASGNVPFVGQMTRNYETGLDIRWAPRSGRRTRFEVLAGGFVSRRRTTGQFGNSQRQIDETHTSFGLQLGTRVDIRVRSKLYLELAVDGRYAAAPMGIDNPSQMLYDQPSWAIQTGFGFRFALFGSAGD